MTDELRKHWDNLLLSTQLKNVRSRKDFLKLMSKDETVYEAIKNIVINLMKGNINLNKRSKLKLMKEKKVIKAFTCNNKCKKKKQKIVEQSGGFLNVVIPLIASVIADIINDQ